MSIFSNLFGKKKDADTQGERMMPVFPQEIYQAGLLDFRDIIAPSALEINANYIRLGSKYARTLFVFTYPRFLATSWFAPIINLDRVFDISIFVHPVDTAIILRNLRKKVAEVEYIQKNIELIKKGIERAYDANMRMVNKALVLYAYVKWLNTGV